MWGDDMKSVNINQMAEKQGFQILIQIPSERDDDSIGYIWIENMKINCNKRIVINENILNITDTQRDYYYRYYVALALAYSELTNEKEKFYKQIRANIHDIEVESLASRMLMPEKEFQKYSKKYKKDITKLMIHFKAPSILIEERLKEKNKVKSLKR